MMGILVRPTILCAAAAVLLMSLSGCWVVSIGSNTSIGTTPSTTPGTTPTAVNNVQPVVLDYGPTFNGQQAGHDNALYTTVTICQPGTAICQSIDHVLIDTGSTGLRILSSVLTLTLPFTTDANNNLIGNCIPVSYTHLTLPTIYSV